MQPVLQPCGVGVWTVVIWLRMGPKCVAFVKTDFVKN
jgi:hypothetical protein